MIRRDRKEANPTKAAGRHRYLPGWSLCAGLIMVGVVMFGVLLAGGCTPATPVSATRKPMPTRAVATQSAGLKRRLVLPTIGSIQREPTLRVRIAKGLRRVEVSCGGELLVGPAGVEQAGSSRRYRRAVAVTYYSGSFLVTDTQGRTVRWALPAMKLASGGGVPIIFNGKAYPGAVVLVPVKDKNGRPTGRLDVVNHVGMESYLPGVLERELYGSWETEAFRAAAVAARSYAVFEASLNADKHYDLESTTASQAYGGRASNPKALSAVSQTRGQLIEYNGRVVPAFYSSSCGGVGQDATAAFTWLRGLPDMQPLRGRSHGGWCQGSDKFRWGPTTRAKASLALRIKTWGKQQDHPVKALRGIRDIRVTKVNSAGRPTAFAVSDQGGMTYTLEPEQFRFACNSSAPGIAKPAKNQSLHSSHARVKVGLSTVTFYEGQGFGHGVGLCQFGTQGLAKAGYNAYSILAFYYPGSRVVRAYP
jgi:stage II sporulation protein D (peptidoglycan lytic transglycosylase)